MSTQFVSKQDRLDRWVGHVLMLGTESAQPSDLVWQRIMIKVAARMSLPNELWLSRREAAHSVGSGLTWLEQHEHSIGMQLMSTCVNLWSLHTRLLGYV
jgi:hypothetical protein